MKVFCPVWRIARFKDRIDVACVVSEIIQSYISHFEQRIWISFQLCQSYISVNTFQCSLKWLPLSSLFWAPPLLSITLSLFLIFYYFGFSLPSPRALFLYSSALTGNGFACHVTLVTDCVMDGILVRALLCLRRTTGQKHPLASHSTCHASHPAHPTLYYLDFLLPLLLFQSNLAPPLHPFVGFSLTYGTICLSAVYASAADGPSLSYTLHCDSFWICILPSF